MRLIRDADVIMKELTAGWISERLGLGYEKVSEEKPDLVFCSLSDHGPGRPLQGPRRDRSLLSQAMSGLGNDAERCARAIRPPWSAPAVVGPGRRGGARGSGRPRRPLRASGHGQGRGNGSTATSGSRPADEPFRLRLPTTTAARRASPRGSTRPPTASSRRRRATSASRLRRRRRWPRRSGTDAYARVE